MARDPQHKVFIGCCMVVLNPKADKVLLAIRKKEPHLGGWQIPGGTVDYGFGDDLISAVIRETKEETGLEINNPQLVGVISTSYYGPQSPLHIVFKGQVDSEVLPPNPEPDKADDWQWVDLNNLPSNDVNWFRMSKIALDLFKKVKTNPSLSRIVNDK